MIRHGSMAAPQWPRIIGLGGPPKCGKTRTVGSCLRGAPEWFGTKGVYVEIDPDGGGSMLAEDRVNWERLTVDPKKYIADELAGIIQHDWKKEGFGTVFIDTGSIAAQTLLMQIAAKCLFGNNIDLGGVRQPTQGDYTGVDTTYFKLLNLQKEMSQASGINFITTYHDLEVRPEQGQAGEVHGGPLLAGKAMTKKVVGWYNFYMRQAFEMRPRGGNLASPPVFDRKLYTQTNGIWQAGIRIQDKVNPIPSVVVGEDPAEAWATIAKLYAKEVTNG